MIATSTIIVLSILGILSWVMPQTPLVLHRWDIDVMDKYSKRLLKEWQEHGKIIIAIDIDDTVLPYKTATQTECDKIINLVKECQVVGAYVIIYTCRNEGGIQEALKYCASKSLFVDAVNKNPINLPYGNMSKPYANIFLDDRADLQAAYNRLAECMYRMRAQQWSQRLDYPGAGG